jgi:hypothetical protein
MPVSALLLDLCSWCPSSCRWRPSRGSSGSAPTTSSSTMECTTRRIRCRRPAWARQPEARGERVTVGRLDEEGPSWAEAGRGGYGRGRGIVGWAGGGRGWLARVGLIKCGGARCTVCAVRARRSAVLSRPRSARGADANRPSHRPRRRRQAPGDGMTVPPVPPLVPPSSKCGPGSLMWARPLSGGGVVACGTSGFMSFGRHRWPCPSPCACQTATATAQAPAACHSAHSQQRASSPALARSLS